MPTVNELLEKRGPIGAKIKRMADTLTGEKRDFNAEEQSQWDRANADFNSLTRQLEVARSAAETDRDSRHRSAHPTPGLEDTVPRRDRYGDGEELRALALQGWVRRQSGHDLTNKQRSACRRVGLNPSVRDLNITLPRRGLRPGQEQRALSVSTGIAGGYTVPSGFVYKLETALLDYCGTREVADVIRTEDGGELPWPTVNDVGNLGEMIAESTSIGNSTDPAFGRVLFGAYKFSSKPIILPSELLEDSAFELSTELSAMLGERIGRAQEQYFTKGTGTGQPQGVVTGASLGKTTASATAILADEIIDLIHSVDPVYRRDKSFRVMAHDLIWSYVRKLKDGEGRYLYEDVKDGGPDRVHGVPISVNQQMDSTVATGKKTMLAGPFKKFKIRDVNRIRVRRLVERYADADQVGFVAFLRSDSKVLDAGTHPIRYLQQA